MTAGPPLPITALAAHHRSHGSDATSKPVVLIASGDLGDHVWLRRCLGDAVVIDGAVASAEVAARASGAALIAIGDALVDATADQVMALLDHVAAATPRVRLGEPTRVAPESPVAYVLSRDMDPASASALVLTLAAPAARRQRPDGLDAEEARRRERAFALSRRLAATTTLAGAEIAATTALLDLVGAERAHCMFYDAGTGDVWSTEGGEERGERRADRGMVGWAARTGSAARTARAALDARWVAAVDDPTGRGDERILVQPASGLDREVHAVLVAVRGAAQPEFGDGEAAALQVFAALAGPLLEQLAANVEASAYLEALRDEGLFLPEAIEASAGRRWGDVVRVAPPWIRWAHRGVLLVMVAAAVLAIQGRVHTYSRGPAVVRMQGRSEVAARTAGNVAAITATAGTRVNAGDLLARLDDGAQQAEVERLDRELEARLRERLLSPGDPASGEAVSRLRLELERSRAALEERLVRAPVAGVVGEVRVRPGQRIAPGDVIASIVDPSGEVGLVAFLPGGDRPRLDRGQRMRLSLAGYRDAYQDLVVDAVAAEAMGPDEARSYLGRIAGDVDMRGPVVLVRARLTGEFVADGVTYRYIDGMSGTVDVQLASERLIDALVPGLRGL